MKAFTASSLVMCFFVASLSVLSLAQNPPLPAKPTTYLESWQGQPGKPDKTDHAPVEKGTTMSCVDVDPKQDGSQCILKYEKGGTETLNYRAFTYARETDVVFLTCNATVPARSCKAQLTLVKKP